MIFLHRISNGELPDVFLASAIFRWIFADLLSLTFSGWRLWSSALFFPTEFRSSSASIPASPAPTGLFYEWNQCSGKLKAIDKDADKGAEASAPFPDVARNSFAEPTKPKLPHIVTCWERSNSLRPLFEGISELRRHELNFRIPTRSTTKIRAMKNL